MSQSYSLRSRCGMLMIRFDAIGDRFGHSIQVQTENGWQRLLHSIESSSNGSPLGPVLQELNACQLPSDESTSLQTCLLGTGQADRSYFSLSVTAASDGLLLDYACRQSAEASAVRQAYETHVPFSASTSAVVTDVEGRCLVGLAESSCHSRRSLMVSKGRLDVSVLPGPNPQGDPKTIRWALRISTPQP